MYEPIIKNNEPFYFQFYSLEKKKLSLEDF